MLLRMRDLVRLIVWMVVDLFRSRAALEAEIWMLRQQINVLRRTAPKKQTFRAIDRLIFVCLYRLLPGVRDALAIVKPETVVKWHRAGFGLYWRWKSKARGGRPTVPLEIRKLIREMSIANPLWGAPRIHGELLKLGVHIGQTSVAKYMVRRRDPPSQGWRTFLRNHADGIAAMDMFVVPTISFRLLYGLLIMGHGRRHILWLAPEQQADPRFAYRVFMVHRTANRAPGADLAVELVPPGSDVAEKFNMALKEVEKRKYLPTEIVATVRAEGWDRFTMDSHTKLWKRFGAKNPAKGYGAVAVGKWCWYETWLNQVREECRQHPEQYRNITVSAAIS